MQDAFDRLADALGVEAAYTHAGGWQVEIPRDIRARLMAAMGFPADTDAQVAEGLARIEDTAWRPGLAPVQVAREGADPLAVVVVRRPSASGALRLTLTREDGTTDTRLFRDPECLDRRADGERERCVLHWDHLPPPGYHVLTVEGDGLDGPSSQSLIVSPGRCWVPAALAGAGRTWGFAAQLYAQRGRTNWGMGDLGDLRRLVAASRDLGAGLVGISPLHALFPQWPERRTPYSPSSRIFLHSFYLDITAMADLAESPEAQARIAAPDFQARLAELRAADMVDYAGVAALKRPILELLWQGFRDRHLARDSDRARAFHAFCAEGGERLEAFARFEALAEHFADRWPWWRDWPAEFRRPDSPAVAAFASEHGDAVARHKYLQWQTDRQLAEAGADHGLAIGLYRDVAVGIDRDGADAWVLQDAVPQGVATGAPPDLRNPVGQDWGVVPLDPRALVQRAYEPFITMIRANMRHAGALRLDHAFQLTRLYWVPLGNPATAGGYVRYPFEDLVDILALETHRNQCLLVAEDLGTIPPGFRERMIDSDALSFRVLHRQRGPERCYLPPAEYPAMAAATCATHDQVTLTGFWAGRDVDQRGRLQLFPSEAARVEAERTRPVDRDQLLAALRDELDFDGPVTEADGTTLTRDFVVAVHRFLARTPSRLMLVQLEDVLGEIDQVNMPATIDQYPNWKRRITVPVEDLADHPMVRAVAEAIADEREIGGTHIG